MNILLFLIRYLLFLNPATHIFVNGTAPHYLAETIRPVSSRGTRQHLRSAETSALLVPSTRRSTLGDRSFCTGLERSTATRSECTFSFHLPPRTEDRSVPVVVLWCDLTMYCALSACPSLSADLSPCTGCYKLISLTLYGGLAAAVR